MGVFELMININTHPLDVRLVVVPHGDALVPSEEVSHQLGPVPVHLVKRTYLSYQGCQLY